MSLRIVPTFASNGKRLRNHSVAHVEQLGERGVVQLSRNAKGRIKACQFLTAIGANPLQKTAHAGTIYSFFNRCGDVQVWEHKQMVQRQDAEALFGLPIERSEDLDLYLRGIFRAVPLSCMRTAEIMPPKSPTKTPAKVVSIASGRRPGERRPSRIVPERPELVAA